MSAKLEGFTLRFADTNISFTELVLEFTGPVDDRTMQKLREMSDKKVKVIIED